VRRVFAAHDELRIFARAPDEHREPPVRRGGERDRLARPGGL
jgi:hypothetical protein